MRRAIRPVIEADATDARDPLLNDLNAWAARALLPVATVMILLLAVLVVGDIAGRVVFGAPVRTAPGMASMAMVVICFLLAGLSVHSGGMIKADILVSAFGARGHAFGQLLSATLGILFFGLIVWGSLEPGAHEWFKGEATIWLAAWPARLIVFLGSVLVVLCYVQIGIDAMGRLISGDAEPRSRRPL